MTGFKARNNFSGAYLHWAHAPNIITSVFYVAFRNIPAFRVRVFVKHKSYFHCISKQGKFFEVYSQAQFKNILGKLHYATLFVKTWSHKKRNLCLDNWHLCYVPETTEHCLVGCKDAILLWDVLQQTQQTMFLVNNSHTVRYLLPSLDEVSYDKFYLIGIHSVWKRRMRDRNAESITSLCWHFIRVAAHIKNVCVNLTFS